MSTHLLHLTRGSAAVELDRLTLAKHPLRGRPRRDHRDRRHQHRSRKEAETEAAKALLNQLQ